MSRPSSPLHEAVSVWRAAQQGTIEDFAELDLILAQYRNEDAALARIAARVCDEDVPMHVAADIDQIIWEQDYLVVTRDFGIASAERGMSDPNVGYFLTAADAHKRMQQGVQGHIITRVTVESPLFESAAHVQHSPEPGNAREDC